MIERMKKLTFLVTQKEYDGFIAGLREQGVVHVQHQGVGRQPHPRPLSEERGELP